VLSTNGLTPTTTEGSVTTSAPAEVDEGADVVRVECANDEMLVTIEPATATPPPPAHAARHAQPEPGLFSGMVYPRGLTKNSSCLVEFVRQAGPLKYRLPLSYCNTMSVDTVSFCLFSTYNLLLFHGGARYYKVNFLTVENRLFR
jgi:hypothetical protein